MAARERYKYLEDFDIFLLTSDLYLVYDTGYSQVPFIISSNKVGIVEICDDNKDVTHPHLQY